MKKYLRILLNLAILLLVALFVLYMFFSLNGKTVEYGETENMTGEASYFESPCTLADVFALPKGTKRIQLFEDIINCTTTDSVYIYSKAGMFRNRFFAGEGISDIAVDGQEIYVLFPLKIKVFTPEGLLLREWEACSDNSLYASIALTKDFVFVTDAENRNMCRFAKDGRFLQFIDSPRGFAIPTGDFDIDSFRDTIYCVNPGRHQIESYTNDGRFIASFGIPGSKPGTFPGCCNPASIAFTSEGQLLTSEKGNPRVCLFERSGRFVEMLLNAKMLGGGHAAYEIQSAGNRIYVAGRNEMKVYTYEKKSTTHNNPTEKYNNRTTKYNNYITKYNNRITTYNKV